LGDVCSAVHIEAVRGFGFRITGAIQTPASDGVRDSSS